MSVEHIPDHSDLPDRTVSVRFQFLDSTSFSTTCTDNTLSYIRQFWHIKRRLLRLTPDSHNMGDETKVPIQFRRVGFLHLSALGDDNLRVGLILRGGGILDLVNELHPFDNAAEHNVLSVQEGRGHGRDEELTPIGIGPGVLKSGVSTVSQYFLLVVFLTR